MNPSPLLSEKALQSLLDLTAGQDFFILLETTRVTEENRFSYIFLNPVDRLVMTHAEQPSHFFRRAETFLRKGFFLAGWIAYELGYLLEPALRHLFKPGSSAVIADLGVFEKPCIIDMYGRNNPGFSGILAGAGSIPASQLMNPELSYSHATMPADPAGYYQITNVRFNQGKHDYLETIKRIRSYIEAGETYQVNYTLKLQFDFSGSPDALYRTLRRNQNVSYGAYIRSGPRLIMSFSPELFFSKRGQSFTVRPMKGTIRRGITAEEDKKLINQLYHSLKNRSENIMIVDLLRNDIGRLCRLGSVRVMSMFDIETYETLHQMTSTIRGELKPGVSLEEIFRAIFPSGSVTGAPKIRTMEIIHELELEKRGVYTGGIGYITPSGDAMFNVPIRTLVLEKGSGEMGIGSGIVYDSDPECEWEECRLKANFLESPLPGYQLIETLLWHPDEGYLFLDLHLERLSESARHLCFSLDLENIIKQLDLESNNFQAVTEQCSIEEKARRVRLLLHKDGTVDLSSSPCRLPEMNFPPPNRPAAEELPMVIFSEQATNSRSIFLYHKTTMRNLYDAERERAVAKGFFEVLFVNERGEVTEGSITNIFVRRGNTFITPPLKCGLLNGVFRRYILDAYPGRVKEDVLRPDDLITADGVYLTNSIRGMIQVRIRPA